MSIADELGKLDQLRRDGVITPQQFDYHRHLLLAPPAPRPSFWSTPWGIILMVILVLLAIFIGSSVLDVLSGT